MEKRKDIALAEETEKQTITDDDVKKAEEIRKKYRRARNSIDKRIKENEEFWKRTHNMIEKSNEDESVNENDIYSTSAWLFNSIANKHADAMDNYPEPNILPREESDRETALQLSKVIPAILENNNFEQTYSDCWWNKLKSGTGCYGVFWNNDLDNGLGNIDINRINILNIDWQPGIMDIQKSRNLFIIDMVDKDLIEIQYGIEIEETGKDAYLPSYVHDDYIDCSDQVAVIDWYYKKRIRSEDNYGRPLVKTVVHLVKYCNGKVLYASENDLEYKDRGWYDHGKYPIVLDTMFEEEDYPVGFGYIDIMKNPQVYIDKLGSAFLENAQWGAKPRYFARQGHGINMDQFTDTNASIVEVSGNFDQDYLKEITTPQLDGNYMALQQNKIAELKETSGNRDFSQGSTSSGVTSGSAIAALMEAGSKLSRDMIKSSYRANNKICYLAIELMRQFYDENRIIRITKPNDEYEFSEFNNEKLKEQPLTVNGLKVGIRIPIFDIQCKSQKASPFSKLSQNELAKEMYQLGFFNPQLADQTMTALEMMEFEGKDMVLQKISQNGMMYQQIMQLQQQVMQLNQIIANITGNNAIEEQQGEQQINAPGAVNSSMGEINSLGQEVGTHSRAESAKEKAANQAGVR